MRDISFKHTHTIVEHYTILHIPFKNEEIKDIYIDTEDLEKVIRYNWFIDRRCQRVGYHICHMSYRRESENSPKMQRILLHRYLMNPKDNELIDHVNHNTLDCRKCNLRKTTNALNLKNRKGKNKNNSTGYRNVSFNKQSGKYLVQLQVNGKNKRLGEFYDVDEAGKFAEKMREEFYGDFKGVG